MSLFKKAFFCLLIYVAFTIISLPVIFLIGDFKDGFIGMHQQVLTIIITLSILITLFYMLKIRKIRYAVVIGFLIQYILAFQGKVSHLDSLLIDGFFISSYLLNPLSYFIFRLFPLIFIINSLLLRLFPAIASSNLLIIAILILIFNIFCWYFLGLLIEKILRNKDARYFRGK